MKKRLIAAVVLIFVESVPSSAQQSVASSPGSFPRTVAEQRTSFDPPYLNDIPSVELIKKEIQGSDPTDTFARQMAVFVYLSTYIQRIKYNRTIDGPYTPDELRVMGAYDEASYRISQDYKKSHTAAETEAFGHLEGHYEFDTAFDQDWNRRLMGPQSKAAYQGMESELGARQASHVESIKRANEKAKAQDAAAQGGSPFIRNDPGTLAARRCVELGGNELKCMGNAMWTGLTDLAGADFTNALNPTAGSHVSGAIMNGWYTGAEGPSLSFGSESLVLAGCGELVPDNHSYAITKKPNQLLINVQSQPAPFVFSMRDDGKLLGPGPVAVTGTIIVGYRRVWMQKYRDGVAVANGGYWSSVPVYEPKTERCTIGMLAQAPPPPPQKNPIVGAAREIAAAVSDAVTLGPPGLRMSGKFLGQGGLALEFADDAVTLDCGEAHVKKPYTVENAATQILITVNNGTSPFTVAMQSNGTLSGSGSTDVAGRVVTGANGDAVTFAPRNARCAIGTLSPTERR